MARNDEMAGAFCLEGETSLLGSRSLHIERWTEQGQTFDLVYLAFHGSQAGQHFDDQYEMTPLVVDPERLVI